MRKVLFLAASLLLVPAVTSWGQELAIFKDYRSLAVLGHRESGKWTYLRLSEGEFAVLTATIREFRREPSSPAGVVSSPAPAPPPRRDWQAEPPPPPPPPDPEPHYAAEQEPPPEPPVEEPPQVEEPPPPPPQAPPEQQVKPFGRPDMKRATIGRTLS